MSDKHKELLVDVSVDNQNSEWAHLGLGGRKSIVIPTIDSGTVKFEVSLDSGATQQTVLFVKNDGTTADLTITSGGGNKSIDITDYVGGLDGLIRVVCSTTQSTDRTFYLREE